VIAPATTSLMKDCAFCGTPYKVQCPARLRRSKYCSHACRQKARYARGEIDMTKLVRPAGIKDTFQPKSCDTCQRTYIPTSNRQRYCLVCAPGQRWRALISRYGITKPIWDRMFAAQDGMCCLCAAVPTCVDHCHTTGRVRGLLCDRCNTRLAALDNLEWKARAEVYLAVCK